MEYHGKLYGRLGGEMYFDTGKTSDDWDVLEKRVAELEAENQTLQQEAAQISVAIEYVEFCVMCDRENLPLLCLEDYIKQYCR